MGPFPTVVHAHGGPDGVITDIYSPDAQAWADAGFAFVTVNYRGSTTFGREFEERILGQPGRWEVEDLVAARAWLIGEGIAVAEEVLVAGGSYGGYLSLLAAGLRPDLWAGAMAIAPIADWLIQAEDANETMRPWTLTLFGGDVAERRHQYLVSSPITYAARVSAPVLLIHGRHDTTVPPRQTELYAATLRALGKSVELVWFEGGHLTFADPSLLVEHQALMLEFASRIVGRRYDPASPA